MRRKQTFFMHDDSISEVEYHTSFIQRCNSCESEAWAGHVTHGQVVALLSPETAKDQRIREVLRGQGAIVYVRVE